MSTPDQLVTLADVEWGDVIAEGDGVLVVEGMVELDGDEQAVLVNRYEDPLEIADAANHLLLAQLGVDVLRVLGHGPGWLVLEHPTERWGWRLAEPDDMEPARAAMDAWQAALAAASGTMPELPAGASLVVAPEPDWTAWAITQDHARALPFDLRALGIRPSVS